MTDAEKLAAIEHIMGVYDRELEDPEGDKYLSDSSYAMEAISAVINDVEYGVLRQFLEA